MQQSTVSRWMQMQGDEKEVEWTENGSTSHGEWGTIVRIEGGGNNCSDKSREGTPTNQLNL